MRNMLAKRLFHKLNPTQVNLSSLLEEDMQSSHLNPRLAVHYGIPTSSSILAFDSIQRILALATLNGRIKIIGKAGVQYLFESPLQLPYKFLEFLGNQGHLVGITKQNDIEIWNLDGRLMACSLQWKTAITAFSVIEGTFYMYIGDDIGDIAIAKFDIEEERILLMPYRIPSHILKETLNVDEFSSVAGIFPQPSHTTTRVLITYSDGSIILWDIYHAYAIVALSSKVNSSRVILANSSCTRIDENSVLRNSSSEEKELCCACWISSDGCVLATGYTDGDVLLWGIPSEVSSKDKHEVNEISAKGVVKLQLTSSERKLPVIILRWSSNEKTNMEFGGGLLFVYGGEELGSPEVVTVLFLQWSNGLQNLTCISSLQVALDGSFADMILLSHAGNSLSHSCNALLILTNPGNLIAYDAVNMTDSLLKRDEMVSVTLQPVSIQETLFESPVLITDLILLPKHSNASRIISQFPRDIKSIAPAILSHGTKWPVTGGILSTESSNTSAFDTLFVSAHEDGTINIWDASVPYLCLLFSIRYMSQNLHVDSKRCHVSALKFCPLSDILVAGDQQGQVQLYRLNAENGEVKSHVITKDKKQAHIFHTERGFQCIATYDLHGSPIRSFSFTEGSRCCFASENGLVTVIDLHTFDVLFTGNYLPHGVTSVLSVSTITVHQNGHLPPSSSPKSGHAVEPLTETKHNMNLVMCNDGTLITADGDTGAIISTRPLHDKQNSRVVSFHLIDVGVYCTDYQNDGESSESASVAYHKNVKEDFGDEIKEENLKEIVASDNQLDEKNATDQEDNFQNKNLDDFLILLCLEDHLKLYPAASILLGKSKSISKVKLEALCCWSSTFISKDKAAVGVSLLYRNGSLEFRSLPTMNVIGSISLNTLLCWNCPPNLSKTVSASTNGRIVLIHNKELAFLSTLRDENDLRIPDSLPHLHDKDLAAAVEAAVKASSSQPRKKHPIQGFLGSVLKDIKVGVLKRSENSTKEQEPESPSLNLSFIFQQCPFPEETTTKKELEDEILDIDDIAIDDFASPSSSLSPNLDGNKYFSKTKKDNKSDRQELLEEKSGDVKPRMRTPEEIKAAYGHKKAQDASAVAAHARDRLHERGEKLQAISKHTEELQAGAENFASMADELLKTMQRRKWWQI